MALRILLTSSNYNKIFDYGNAIYLLALVQVETPSSVRKRCEDLGFEWLVHDYAGNSIHWICSTCENSTILIERCQRELVLILEAERRLRHIIEFNLDQLLLLMRKLGADDRSSIVVSQNSTILCIKWSSTRLNWLNSREDIARKLLTSR